MPNQISRFIRSRDLWTMTTGNEVEVSSETIETSNCPAASSQNSCRVSSDDKQRESFNQTKMLHFSYFSLIVLFIASVCYPLPNPLPNSKQTATAETSNSNNPFRASCINCFGSSSVVGGMDESVSRSRPSSAAPLDLEQNAVVNNIYKIESMLGRGWTGRVYKATNLETQKEIALKLVPISLTKFAENEQDLLVRLGRSEGELIRTKDFIAIPTTLIKGIPLRLAMFDGRDTSILLKNAHEALRRFHETYGLAHGDPNLGNFMVDSEGNVQLIDFAKSTPATAFKKKIDHRVLDLQFKTLKTFPFLDFIYRVKLWPW